MKLTALRSSIDDGDVDRVPVLGAGEGRQFFDRVREVDLPRQFVGEASDSN